MAMARSGIQNILVITGDYPSPEGYQGAGTPVFDLDSVQAIRYLKGMNAGLEIPGRKPGTCSNLPPTKFLIAAGVSPFKLTEEELMMQIYSGS